LGVCRKAVDNAGADLGRNFSDWADWAVSQWERPLDFQEFAYEAQYFMKTGVFLRNIS